MNYSNFDKYRFIMLTAAILVALLTYWRYWSIDPASTFDYVAQGSVVKSIFSMQSIDHRPLLWDFFGVVERMIDDGSIYLLKTFSIILVVINLLVIFKLVSFLLDQRFWGFIALFLFGLTPPCVAAAVSGGPEAASLTIMLLFLYSLYRNQYLIAAMLSGIALTINLPGVIFFIVVIFDILQNVKDQKKIFSFLIWVPLIFFGFLGIVYFYESMIGTFNLAVIPFRLSDFKWNLLGTLPLFLTNALNIVGIAYLIRHRRYDVYIKHFHLLMLWLAFGSFAIASPTTVNVLNSLAVSLILFLFFLQGLPLVWQLQSASTELFVVGFVILFLSFNLLGNNYFLHDQVLPEAMSRKEAVREVVSSVKSVRGVTRILSNFVPGEIAVKLGENVYAVGGSVIPARVALQGEGKIIYIVEKPIGSEVRDVPCKSILSTMYFSESGDRTIKVFVCEEGNE